MDFLTLCQRTAREAGISGSGPSVVTGQTGQLANVIEWVKLAWKDIQNEPYEWKFHWTQDNVNSLANDPVIDMDSKNIKSYDEDMFWCYLTSAGTTDRQRLTFINYQKFKRLYQNLANPATGRPTMVTELPNGDLQLYPVPPAIYTVEYEGYSDVQELDAGTDEPLMPSRFHDIIIFRALMDHGRYEDAVEIRQEVPKRYDKMWMDLLWDQANDPSKDGLMVVTPE